MKYSIYHVMGYVYLGIWASKAFSEVGKIQSHDPYTFTVWNALSIVLCFVLPFALGFLAGKEDE